MSAAGMRVPLTQGLPRKMAGSLKICSRQFILKDCGAVAPKCQSRSPPVSGRLGLHFYLLPPTFYLPMSASVYLVGAGPGDPGLVTLRARDLIARCDVLVYDRLVNPELQTWVKPGCELIYVGKDPHLHAIPQDDIEDLIVARAKAGKTVVRLKGGDPFIFGRGGEEAQRLARDGVSFEIVPEI